MNQKLLNICRLINSAIRTYGRATYRHYAVRDSDFRRDQKRIKSLYIKEVAVDHLADFRSQLDGGGLY